MATFEELMREAQKFFDARDYNTAEIIYSEIIAMNPNSKDAYFQRAEIYDLFEDYEKALADYNKALEFEQNENYYFGRGRIYAKLKQYEKALVDYTKAIRNAEFEHPELYNERGWTYIKLENVKRSIFDFNKAVEVAPGDSTGYNGRAWALFYMKKYYKAIDDFNKAIELDFKDKNPDFEVGIAYQGRGRVYEELGEQEKARADFDTAKKLGYQPEE